MKYLNLGCGSHYSKSGEWTNLDFVSTGEGVSAHNLLNGIPFNNECFDLVYHSHVLEHFSKKDGVQFIAECFRVLKPGGILRIAIPDLEGIAGNYLKCIEEGIKDPGNDLIRANYEWMLLEMYDQTVRNKSGGDMGNYLAQDTILNESFVYSRIGEEGRAFRRMIVLSKQEKDNSTISSKKKWSSYGTIKAIMSRIKFLVFRFFGLDTNTYEIGKFRISGEIHQWMYDRYSLTRLLISKGGTSIVTRNAFDSYIVNWADYNIDGKNNIIRKPDSLFMEAIKK